MYVNTTWSKEISIPLKQNTGFRFQYVSVLEVKNILSSMNSNKSAGADDLPPRLLRDSANAISKPLSRIINQSLQTGVFPTAFKEAKVLPLFKSGAASDINNYRPISILPALSKVVERVVHNQLSNYLEENNLLLKCQYGFRKERSTERAATVFLDEVRFDIERGMLVTALFLDLSKAFDTVSHSKLLDKLVSYGIKEIEYSWFCDYLFNRSQRVIYNGNTSDKLNVEIGVPQGSILGPILFILFINDFTDCIKNAKVVQYADDTVLYVSDKCKLQLEKKLSEDVKLASTWFDKNELMLNLKKGKTEVLTFGTPAKLRNIDIKVEINDTIIANVNEYKYLGLTFDSTLNMRNHFKNVFKKSSGRLRLLYRLRPDLSQEAAKLLYQSLIIPVLTYCSLLFINLTNTEKNKLKSFHARALDIINWRCQQTIHITPLELLFKKRACEFVVFCLNTNIEQYRDYFEFTNHERITRNNGFLLRMPNLKLEYARKSVKYSCCRIFNNLPLDLRKKVFSNSFKSDIKKYFS